MGSRASRTSDSDESWARLLQRTPSTLGRRAPPPVVLWAGGSTPAPAGATAGAPDTPTNQRRRGGSSLAGGGIEKIALDSPTQSWSRSDSPSEEEGRRDEGPRNQYKSPSKLEHLGERVRRFRCVRTGPGSFFSVLYAAMIVMMVSDCAFD